MVYGLARDEPPARELKVKEKIINDSYLDTAHDHAEGSTGFCITWMKSIFYIIGLDLHFDSPYE